MPYLNWKELVLEKKVTPEPESDRNFILELVISPAQSRQLAESLFELFDESNPRPHAELRLDLPDQWILFWKPREAESRLLIAHPEKEEWVATLALERAHGLRFIEVLKESLEAGVFPVSLGSLGSVSSASNLEILIHIRQQPQISA